MHSLLKSPDFLASPVTRLVLALAMIAGTEAGMMLASFRLLPEDATPSWLHIAIDILALTAVGVPLLWWLFIRPLQQSAEQARAQAQTIMETAGEGIITTDERGLVLSFNRAAEAIFGYTAEEIRGQNVSILMPTPQRDNHDHYIRAYISGAGAKVIGRKRIMTGLRKDGAVFPLEIAVSDIRVGGQRMFTSVVHDISAYKAAEAALSHSNQLLERIFCGIHSLVAYMDRDFNFIRVNCAYAAADGRTPDFFPGKNHFALYPNPQNEAIFRQVVETGEPYEAHARPFSYDAHPDRGASYWDVRLTPVKDENGRVESLLLTLLDVTKRELAEQERLRAVTRFRLLFENAGDAIFIHEPEGRFIEANQVACERLGYTREELLMLTPRQIDSPEFAARLGERLTQLYDKGAIVFESAHVRRNGSVVPVEIASRLIDYEGRKVVMSVARDITERKRMEAAVQESEENARALLNAIDESAMLLTVDGIVLAINETGARRWARARQDSRAVVCANFCRRRLPSRGWRASKPLRAPVCRCISRTCVRGGCSVFPSTPFTARRARFA